MPVKRDIYDLSDHQEAVRVERKATILSMNAGDRTALMLFKENGERKTARIPFAGQSSSSGSRRPLVITKPDFSIFDRFKSLGKMAA